MADYFIGAYSKNSSTKYSLIKFMLYMMACLCCIFLIYGVILLSFNIYSLGISSILSFMAAIGICFLFKTKTPINTITNAVISVCFIYFTICILFTGNTSSPFIPWLIAIPALAITISKNLTGLIWTVLCMVFFSTITLLSVFNNDMDLLDLPYNKFLFKIIIQGIIYITLIIVGFIARRILFKSESSETIKQKRSYSYISYTDIELLIMDWNFLKYKFSKKFNEQIEEIDQLDFLTPHEKKYALIDYFKLDLILISETLSVSTRTVETNYYRLRKKLKENNCQEKYPFHRIK